MDPGHFFLAPEVEKVLSCPLHDHLVRDQRGRCVVAYSYHLGVALWEIQDPVAEEVFNHRVLSLVMSLMRTMMLNTEL